MFQQAPLSLKLHSWDRLESAFLQDNLVLSSGLIMWIGHREEIWKLRFRALALLRSESRNSDFFDSLRRRANARSLSFQISSRWPIYIINPVNKTKLSRNRFPPTQHYSFSFQHSSAFLQSHLNIILNIMTIGDLIATGFELRFVVFHVQM